MPRHHAVIKTSIWNDPQFCALSALTQRLYLQILTQPNLALTGTINYSPQRWARRARSLIVEDVEASVLELEKADFVLVDRDTDELMIRTFIQHDLPAGRLSAAVLKGFWAAWKVIESIRLQRLVVAAIAVDTWPRFEKLAPPTALQMRRSSPLEREDVPPLDWESPPPPEWEEAPPLDWETPPPLEWDEASPPESNTSFPLPCPDPYPQPDPDPALRAHVHAHPRAGARASAREAKPDPPQPGRVYQRDDAARRDYDAQAPPANPQLGLTGIASARATLAETR